MKGQVLDGRNKKGLAASFELIDLESGKTMIRSSSDALTGEFLVALPSGKNYALNVSCKGYLFYSENFQLNDTASATKPFLKDVLMSPIAAGERMVLKNIFFATDSFNLKKESKIELDKLAAFLKSNAGLKIEISGHTDNVGDKKYNQALSDKRARSVVDYLTGMGIAVARLTSKGYGDTKPVATNASEEGRAQNRRTEFTVVSLN
jgi:outer membrane protein OmpA-like peptidoglycan-associated protein